MQIVLVELVEHQYPIVIGVDLLSDQELLRQHIQGQQVLIVSNSDIAALYLKPLQQSLVDLQCDHLILPAGEQQKNLQNLEQIFESLCQQGHRRSTTLIALGGGVIGDITGFAAACYQRGVNFIQIPTTLLAQVDASVGGKTAVNIPQAKNMVGAFHQPKAVIIDINTLKSLPAREYQAGLAEVIKTALIADADFFDWLETHWEAILQRQPEELLYLIKRCCEIKADVVQLDEKETTGERAVLNFGHTFAHAIEVATQYQDYLHGEAVAIGMVLANEYAIAIGLIDQKLQSRVKNLLTSAQLPIKLPKSLQGDQLLLHMASDKKQQDSGLVLVLLRALGCATICKEVDLLQLQEVIDARPITNKE